MAASTTNDGAMLPSTLLLPACCWIKTKSTSSTKSHTTTSLLLTAQLGSRRSWTYGAPANPRTTLIGDHIPVSLLPLPVWNIMSYVCGIGRILLISLFPGTSRYFNINNFQKPSGHNNEQDSWAVDFHVHLQIFNFFCLGCFLFLFCFFLLLYFCARASYRIGCGVEFRVLGISFQLRNKF